MRRLALLLALLTAPAVPAAPEDPAPTPATADAEVLRQLIREDGIETAEAPPGPTLYFRDLMVAIAESLRELFRGLLPNWGTLGKILEWVARVLVGLVVLVLGLLLLRLVRRWRRRTAPQETAVRVRPLPPDRPGGRTREEWEAALRRHLEAHDVAAALAALWWWLASGLVDRDVDPAWTSRELIARAGRRDLAAPVRILERMIYGAETPGVEAVERFWGQLREAVG